MADIIDTLKTDFEAYKTAAEAKLKARDDQIAALQAAALDPAKAQALDTEIQAATAALPA